MHRVLKKGQFTSLVTNFENWSLNSVKVYSTKDLVFYDQETKQMRNLEEHKKQFESSESDSGQPLLAGASSNSSDQNLEQDVDDCPSNRLFVGVIEINKCEEEVRNLYNRVLENGINYKTEFWKAVKPHDFDRNAVKMPDTIEELKEVEKIHDEISKKFEDFNDYTPRIQYFKPHTASAKRFL